MSSAITEYSLLRAEILQVHKTVEDLHTFLCTLIITLIGLSIQFSISYTLLIGAFLIIIFYLRIKNYRIGLQRISAYMIVFLDPQIEGFNWETTNWKLDVRSDLNKEKLAGLKQPLNWIKNYDIPILYLCCMGGYLFIQNKIFGTIQKTDWVIISIMLIILIILIIDIYNNKSYKVRLKIINHYMVLKNGDVILKQKK